MCVCVCVLDLQLDDVRMSEEFEVLDLPLNLPHHIQTADPLPVQDLHGYLVACELVLSNCKSSRCVSVKLTPQVCKQATE